MAGDFQPFDRGKEVAQTRRYLPHWQQVGATYFVTFRLADSLPARVVKRLQEQHRLSPHRAFDSMEPLLDEGSGSCLLELPANHNLMESVLRYFDERRYSLGAYAVMPNHVHALVQPLDKITLTEILRSWKTYSATHLTRPGIHVKKVWQTETFDRIVRDESELLSFHQYILQNPAAAGLRSGTFAVGCGSAKWIGCGGQGARGI